MMGAGWHKEDIKAAVRKRGSSLHRLARENGLNPITMTVAVYTRLPGYHDVIAEFIGVPHRELWPHWYDENGLRGKTRPDARTKRRIPPENAAHTARMAG